MRALGHLPYFDFLPYKVGNDIGTLMKPQEQARYKYVMERNGQTQEFDQYPTDTTWKYKEMEVLNPVASSRKSPILPSSTATAGTIRRKHCEAIKLLLIIQNTEKPDRDAVQLNQQAGARRSAA